MEAAINLFDHWPKLLLYFTIINTRAHEVYSYDKKQSQKKKFRVSTNEYGYVLFGGWIDALIAMIYCRHKTNQIKFQISYLTFTVVNIFIVYFIR